MDIRILALPLAICSLFWAAVLGLVVVERDRQLPALPGEAVSRPPLVVPLRP